MPTTLIVDLLRLHCYHIWVFDSVLILTLFSCWFHAITVIHSWCYSSWWYSTFITVAGDDLILEILICSPLFTISSFGDAFITHWLPILPLPLRNPDASGGILLVVIWTIDDSCCWWCWLFLFYLVITVIYRYGVPVRCCSRDEWWYRYAHSFILIDTGVVAFLFPKGVDVLVVIGGG